MRSQYKYPSVHSNFSLSQQTTLIQEPSLTLFDLQTITNMRFNSIVAASVMFSGAVVSAAECSCYGLCTPGQAGSRNSLYAARQHVCGDGLYKNDGGYKVPGGGYLSWPGGFDQQRCWDAFENILNQCRPEGAGLGNHCGSYNWYGKLYKVAGCKLDLPS